MTQQQFALSWDAHKKNICNGLSYLQQNGEFVDMTLAADGHSVKVHQIILALASPYIKELIASAQSPHPIIFLNRMSYKTLCSILEYIYTGEAMVSSNNLDELLEAGRNLHIKGLEDMNMNQSAPMEHTTPLQYPSSMQSQNEEDDVCFFEVTEEQDKEQFQIYTGAKNMEYDETKETILNSSIENVRSVEESFTVCMQEEDLEDNVGTLTDTENIISDAPDRNPTIMQYTVSNQGSLQMILNRFVYYLKHTNRNNTRQWRCVDYVTSIKCPAHVVTKDDVVLQRIAAHTHPFHDKRILKKVHAGAIFSAIQEAEKQGHEFGSKKNKSKNNTDSEHEIK